MHIKIFNYYDRRNMNNKNPTGNRQIFLKLAMCPDQDENNKFFWRLARVKELLANSMRVRATIMSTRHEKTTRRALNHLYPLEVENEETNPTSKSPTNQ